MQPPPRPTSPAASPRPVTSSAALLPARRPHESTGGYETVLPLCVWAAQSAAADLRLSLGHRRRRLLPSATAASIIQRGFKQFTSHRTARAMERILGFLAAQSARAAAVTIIQRGFRRLTSRWTAQAILAARRRCYHQILRRRHTAASGIQRCYRSYLFRRRLHPHPEGRLHECADGNKFFAHLLIKMDLLSDCFNIAQSLKSTMDCWYHPTTDRDLSIQAHLEEGKCMENVFQRLLHLMSYENKFSH